MTRPFYGHRLSGPGFGNYYYNFHRWRGGPRRLVWFGLGALAAVMWTHHKEHHQRWGGLEREWREMRRAAVAPAEVEGKSAAVNIRAGTSEGGGNAGEAHAWGAERERMKELGRHAGETMTEMSEATIDSMLATLQGLKARLAERHAPPPPPPPVKPEEPAPPRHWV